MRARSCIQYRGEEGSMTVSEALEQVQFVVGPNGQPTAALEVRRLRLDNWRIVYVVDEQMYRRFWLLFDKKDDCEIIHTLIRHSFKECVILQRSLQMDFKVRSWLSGMAVASALVLAACGGSTGGTGGGGPSALNISTAGEGLQFAPGNLSAAAGDVKVTFKNGSSVQKHNWVLVKGGDDVAKKVDDEGVTAGEAKGYIPDDPGIVAHTKLVNGGETDTATANLAPGTYTFLCTFPGHFATGMKGTLTVK